LNFTDSLTVTIFDEDIMMDDFVGEGEFGVSELCRGVPTWYDLNFEGKKSAEV